MAIYGVMIIGGILGILLHTYMMALLINKRLKMKDSGQVFGELWRTEYVKIIGSFLCYSIILFVASEWVDFSKVDQIDYSLSLRERLYHLRIANYIKTSSVIGGYFCESIIYVIFGSLEQRLRKKLDQASKIIGDIPNE